MKTNVTIISEKDRNLFGVVIRQDTKDCMLSLTDLQEAYSYARVLHGWKDKDIHNILQYEENIERIFFILREQKNIDDKTTLTWFYEKVKEKGVTKILKELNCYRTTGRGENKNSVCNPYIWTLVAMELNPMLYAKVIMWITDKLILNRIEAGNFYKSLSAALYKIQNPDYKSVSVALNIAIFKKHETGIRNKGSKEELEALYRLEDNVAFAINRGFVKTMPEILSLIKESAEQTSPVAAA